MINCNVLIVDDVLLVECDFVIEYDVLCIIVCKVFGGLVEEGLLMCRWGVGMFVVMCVEKSFFKLLFFLEDMIVCGCVFSSVWVSSIVGMVMFEELLLFGLLLGLVVYWF